MFLFQKPVPRKPILQGTPEEVMERKWSVNGTQTSGREKTAKRGVFPPFYAEEQKDREYAIKTIVFSET